jgi:uncharacterized protein (UPF0216 family)
MGSGVFMKFNLIYEVDGIETSVKIEGDCQIEIIDKILAFEIAMNLNPVTNKVHCEPV